MISSPFLNEKETMYAIQDAICSNLHITNWAFCGDKDIIPAQYTAEN